MKESPKLIAGWKELAELEPSPTHYLEIEVENCNGWLKEKGVGDDKLGVYLSTHTFYGSKFTHSTRLLQESGFNVQLANWDADNTQECFPCKECGKIASAPSAEANRNN